MGSVFSHHRTNADRSAKDRSRHKEKIEKAIKEGIHDIVAEESIIGQDGKNHGKVWSKTLNESILTGYVAINDDDDYFLTDYFTECWCQGLVRPGITREYETMDH